MSNAIVPYITVTKEARERLKTLTNEIDRIQSLVSATKHSTLRDLCKSLDDSLQKLTQLAHEYDTYNLQLLPHDVNIPYILNHASCRIGGGAFGDVYESVLNGSKVAVKVSKDGLDEAKRDFANEIKILRLLRHDNIVAFRGSGFLDDNQRRFVVMELVKDNLHSYIHARPGDESGISAFLTWHISKQVGNALLFLHSKGVAHGDIKPDNILLDLTPVFPRPKLCDFGFSWKIYGEIVVVEGRKGHVRYRTQEDEVNFKRAVVADVFGFGLVILECRTGKRPWGSISSEGLLDSEFEDFHEYSEPTKSKKYWKIRDVKLAEVFVGELGKTVVDCCDKKLPLDVIMKNYDKENPYKANETEGEFFSCGFLTNTNIYVVDSIVKEETDVENKLPAYQPEDLICDVDLLPNKHDYIPKTALLQEKYNENHKKFRAQAEEGTIDDNPLLALKYLRTTRAGEAEAQKISLNFIKSTYCHHRAMRDIWREFDEVEKNYHLKDKNSVHPLFSTSFGLHVAILTNEGKGKRKFVFTQRSNRKGVPSPGAFTCGAVESCSVKDFLQPATQGDATARVSLTNTAARGLAEELGLKLSKEDKNAINLNTTYLKFDNHEWGMCGFVDLTDKRISQENQWNFQQLNAAFTGAPKDRFEHSRIYGVDFDLKTMVEWIRKNHNNMASSGKIVVVKVLDTYFGTSAVTKEFQSYMMKEEPQNGANPNVVQPNIIQ